MTVVRYTLLRLLLLFGVMIAIWLLGGLVPALRDPVLLVMFTVLVSVVLSYVVLRGPREAMTAQLAGRISGRLPAQDADPDAAAEDAEAEDAEADAARSAQSEAQTQQDAESQLGASGVAQHGHQGQARRSGADDAPGRPDQDG